MKLGSLIFLVLVCFVSSSVAIAASPAEEMLGLLPDGTFFAVACDGGDNSKEAFEKSSIGIICKDPQVQMFVEQVKMPLINFIKSENSGEPFPAGAFELAGAIASCPIAAGAVERKNSAGNVSVYGCVIVNTGEKKDSIAALIAKIEAALGAEAVVSRRIGSVKVTEPKVQDEVHVYWGWHNDMLVLGINDKRGSAIRNIHRGRTGTDALKITGDTGQISDDVLIIGGDLKRVIDHCGSLMQTDMATQEFEVVKRVLDRLGISSINGFSARVGFEGRDVVVDGLLALSGLRKGLLALSNPVDLSCFDKVEAIASSTTACNEDISGLYDLILDVIKAEAGEQKAPMIEGQIVAFQQQLGIDIRDGLIKNLAGPMVFYTVPSYAVSQAPTGGYVLIAEVKDGELFDKNMKAAGTVVSAMSQGMMQVNPQQTPEGVTLNNWVVAPLAMMQIIPCWAIVGDDVVIGSNAALVTRAISQINSPNAKKTSIRSVEAFKKMEAQLPDDVIGVQYDDTATQLKGFHRQIQQIWPMLTMAAGSQNVQLPVMLPNIDHLTDSIGPSSQYVWINKTGIRLKYKGFGMQMRGADVGGMSAMGLAMLMPALNKSKQTAQRVVAGTNLKAIAAACHVYANDNGDKFPPTLESLCSTVDLSAKSLESPRKPKGFEGPSFIYIPGQTGVMSPQNVLAYENPDFAGQEINVLYLDGHVAPVSPEELGGQLAKTRQQIRNSKTD